MNINEKVKLTKYTKYKIYILNNMFTGIYLVLPYWVILVYCFKHLNCSANQYFIVQT